MTEQQFKALISALASPIRIFLMASFLLLAKAGWFTWLTPESVHGIVNNIMDWLVLAAPAVYMIWAGVKAFREKLAAARASQPEVIIAKAAAVIAPTGGTIVTTPEIASAVPAVNVVAR